MFRYTFLLDDCIVQIYTNHEIKRPNETATSLCTKCVQLARTIRYTKRLELIEISEINEPEFFYIPSYSANAPYDVSESNTAYKNTKNNEYVIVHSRGGIAYFKDMYQSPLEFGGNENI